MSCIEQMKYKIHLERTSFKDSREYIEKNSDEVYYVLPGYKIFKDCYIIGIPLIAVGAKYSPQNNLSPFLHCTFPFS